MTMRFAAAALGSIALASAAALAPAQAALFRCASPDDPGQLVVTNVLDDAQARDRQCQPLQQRASPLNVAASGVGLPARATPPVAPMARSQPATRPLPAGERGREDERRRVLEDELRAEQQALAKQRAQNAAAPGDAEMARRAARHVENIAALQREIARQP